MLNTVRITCFAIFLYFFLLFAEEASGKADKHCHSGNYSGADYAGYRELRDEVQELLLAKRNMERLMEENREDRLRMRQEPER